MVVGNNWYAKQKTSPHICEFLISTIHVRPWWSFSVSSACFFLLTFLLLLDVDVRRAASSHKRPIFFHFYKHKSKKQCQRSGTCTQLTSSLCRCARLTAGIRPWLRTQDADLSAAFQSTQKGPKLFIWEYNLIINHWNQVISIPPYKYHSFLLVENQYSVNNVCGFYEMNFCTAA